jgi:branched-chain amino acid:cation transporter, LIVCS family
MEQSGKLSIWSTGFAIFAMFFGAGNVVFPLVLGLQTLNFSTWGLMGLILTAVVVPLAGLFAMLLFDGDYRSFFDRIGGRFGFLIIFVILAVIGPLAGVPRCIAISFSTLQAAGVSMGGEWGLFFFSILNALLLFLCAWRPHKIVDLIGKVLTPILLISLAVIIVKGLWVLPALKASALSRWSSFSLGFQEGYNTLDLVAAFFFSSVVLLGLKEHTACKKTQMRATLMGGGIAAMLLSVVYIAFCLLAAGYGPDLQGVAGHELLGALAQKILGPYAGLIVGSTVFFACFTTEIALVTVFARFLMEILPEKYQNYTQCLGVASIISFLMSNLNFTGISYFLGPVIQLAYPALILLTVVNIAHKLSGFSPVKRLFYPILIVTILLQYLNLHWFVS